METIVGIILLVAAVFLVASVLLQNSKSHKLPGAIAGGAETFFGKTKGSKLDRILEIATIAVAIVFCLLVLILYVTQDTTDYNALLDSMINTEAVETQDLSAMTPGTVEDTAEVVEDTTEVVEDTAEVVEDNAEVVEDNAEVVEDNAEVVEDNAEVVEA